MESRTNDENIHNSYILREYFKAFKLNNLDLAKLRDKVNKTDRNYIFDYIVKNNQEIYNTIADNYSKTIDLVK